MYMGCTPSIQQFRKEPWLRGCGRNHARPIPRAHPDAHRRRGTRPA